MIPVCRRHFLLGMNNSFPTRRAYIALHRTRSSYGNSLSGTAAAPLSFGTTSPRVFVSAYPWITGEDTGCATRRLNTPPVGEVVNIRGRTTSFRLTPILPTCNHGSPRIPWGHHRDIYPLRRNVTRLGNGDWKWKRSRRQLESPTDARLRFFFYLFI
jgi:hypothetical protein